MALASRCLASCGFILLIFFFEVLIFVSLVRSEISGVSATVHGSQSPRSFRRFGRIPDCGRCNENENIRMGITYPDALDNFQFYKFNSSDLSSSWICENPLCEKQPEGALLKDDQLSPAEEPHARLRGRVKLNHENLGQGSRENRAVELVQLNKDAELQMQNEAIRRSRQFNNPIREMRDKWNRDSRRSNTVSTIRIMQAQIVMAKVYASIARSKNDTGLANSLMKHVKESLQAIGGADSDAELHWSVFQPVKSMGNVLNLAKYELYDCGAVTKKLRAMVQSTEDSMNALVKQASFLTENAVKSMPKPLHCLPLQLTIDYYLQKHSIKEAVNKKKLVDVSLYHYAIFSDNILAASVVVNSTVSNAKEPGNHVFHIVTDRWNFAAMKMWFIAHSPSPATIHVESIDHFKWLNSSYCSVLRQMESSSLRQFYFGAKHPPSVSAGYDNLKFRNPKYLSLLNHLRFYMPELYPKLDKILFLDDDVVVQKDLTALWSVDMKGMVNGAVETCKLGVHRYRQYLNFSHPIIHQNFDPKACGWAFGMNIFDLKEWRSLNLTQTYHYWQDLNEERQLWKLGSLPPGLLTFYKLTYPLDQHWHLLKLGYNGSIKHGDVDRAAVIHYNGIYKPWLDIAYSRYVPYWSKYVHHSSPYFHLCVKKLTSL
ncbi:putative polygalacturonate 4-alpha-galacturonosyltransferase [Dioscorea sansibarensis]